MTRALMNRIGTTVIPNVWRCTNDMSRAITQDEESYPDAKTFKPERFFNADGTLNDDTMYYVFGFGRRYATPAPHNAKCLHDNLQGLPRRYLADAMVR